MLVFVGLGLLAGCHWLLPLQEQRDGHADGRADAMEPRPDGFYCDADQSATLCEEGQCTWLGYCPLGCDVATRRCNVPSNVAAGPFPAGLADLAPEEAGSPLTLDTDTGEIKGSGGQLRAPGTGLDAQSGIQFERVDRPGAPGLGVFSVLGLRLAGGIEIGVEGSSALVILAQGDVTIDGVIDVGARGQQGGPGGFAGGDGNAPGAGSGAGQPGVDNNTCVDLVASGGGGGGHGEAGGHGGPVTTGLDCGVSVAGGAGGSACGEPGLEPLVGGSGGAGGTGVAPPLPGGHQSLPGAGGGGGGAIQISARGKITLGAGGGITAPGDGGGESRGAGGPGGGAGGAILIEGPQVSMDPTSFLAANGGGGGGGDCD